MAAGEGSGGLIEAVDLETGEQGNGRMETKGREVGQYVCHRDWGHAGLHIDLRHRPGGSVGAGVMEEDTEHSIVLYGIEYDMMGSS